MDKAKFVECATLLDNAQKDYFEKITQAKEEFIKNTKKIEKQFELNIFTGEEMNEERKYIFCNEAHDIVLEHVHDDANIINAVISAFTCEGENIYNTRFY